MVFKGGTSLSKVYGVIDRFSEDIDLSMSPAFVGADEASFGSTKSRARRDAAFAQSARLRADAPHVHRDTTGIRGLLARLAQAEHRLNKSDIS